jgi:hypothetical protein
MATAQRITSAAHSQRRDVATIGAVWALSLGDLAMTLWMMHTTGMYESNPLAAALAEHGPLALITFKLATTAIAAGGLWAGRRTRIGRTAALAALGIMLLLSFQWARVLSAGDQDGHAGSEVPGARWVCKARSCG